MNYYHSNIHSSFNSDRIGACLLGKVSKPRKLRGTYLCAVYCRNKASVCGARGKKRFTVEFKKNVDSAIVTDGILRVVVSGEVYKYNAFTGDQIPTFPAPNAASESRKLIAA